jgi:hypothetical protein
MGEELELACFLPQNGLTILIPLITAQILLVVNKEHHLFCKHNEKI